MYRKSKPNGVLGVDKAMYYWIQILLAVHQLHMLVPSIMHKDIKSGNVLLTNKNKEARLADFEYAVVLEKGIDTAKLRPCGTRFFCAPEVICPFLMFLLCCGHLVVGLYTVFLQSK